MMIELSIVEKTFLQIIDKFEKEDLKWAIDTNYNVSTGIKENPDIIPEEFLGFIKSIAYSNSDSLKINRQNVLNWLKKNNFPFFYILDTHPKGKIWLQKQIDEVKSLILGF